MPTIPDKPPKSAATPTTNTGRVYVSPKPDTVLALALLDVSWAIIMGGARAN